MRILEITFNPPNKKSGGGLGIYQSICSLTSIGDVDYIGPYFEQDIMEEFGSKIHIHSILRSRNVSLMTALLRYFGKHISTSYYDDWLNCLPLIDWNIYDFVHIEFSRYYFVVKKCHYNRKICIIRMHNIESDYGYNIFRSTKKILDYLRFRIFHYNEKHVVKNADVLVFITTQDIKRALKLYNFDEDKAYKNPLCLKNTVKYDDVIKINHTSLNILMTGSLNYGPNIDGILWFLKNVWTRVNESNYNVFLVIAGASPCEELKTATNSVDNVTLIESPDKMDSYFKSADSYFAVVFNGAGMKVKVAEALSYGLPVFGTSHALVGYEEICEGKYLANSVDEFLSYIDKLCTGEMKLPSKNVIIDEFEKFFSMGRSENFYRGLARKIGLL